MVPVIKNSPTGMAVGNGMLFVCDGDALKVFELPDAGKGYREVHIAGSGYRAGGRNPVCTGSSGQQDS